MSFKIGAMLESFRCGTEEAVRKCVELGVQGIQFYATAGDLDVDRASDQSFRQFAKLLESNGLCVSAICADIGGFGFERREDNQA